MGQGRRIRARIDQGDMSDAQWKYHRRFCSGSERGRERRERREEGRRGRQGRHQEGGGGGGIVSQSIHISCCTVANMNRYRSFNKRLLQPPRMVEKREKRENGLRGNHSAEETVPVGTAITEHLSSLDTYLPAMYYL